MPSFEQKNSSLHLCWLTYVSIRSWAAFQHSAPTLRRRPPLTSDTDPSTINPHSLLLDTTIETLPSISFTLVINDLSIDNARINSVLAYA